MGEVITTLPISPEVITDYKPGTLPAYVSNGVIGFRIGKIPFFNCRCCLNGFVGMDPVERVQGMEYVPYPVGVDISIDSYWMSQMQDCVRFVAQSYDFSCGELTSIFEFKFKDVTVSVTVLVFCSRTIPNLVMQKVKIKTDKDSRVSLKAKIDPNEVPVKLLLRDTVTSEDRNYMEGAILFESNGGITKAGIAYRTRMEVNNEITKKIEIRGFTNELSTTYSINAQKDKEYSLEQYAAVVPSVMHSEPDRQAIRLMNLAVKRGFENVRFENKNKWDEIWNGRIIIHSDDRKWQKMADAAFYYLHSSVHEASPCSTGLFGLGLWDNYHYFRGHVFWDIEVFTQPTLLLTSPYAAKTILNYRSNRLDNAKKNALMNGYRGAMFPWESSIYGEEVTPSPWPDIFHEQHINMGIANAMAQYIHATDDDIFLKEHAWPVVSGIAEWIVSRVIKTSRGYEILHVTGIDEGACYVDNNSWTNCGAIVALDEAINLAKRLCYSIPKTWSEIRDNIYLPVDPDTKVLLKYDGFDHLGGGCCPDSLAAFFPLNYKMSEDIEKATYDFYLSHYDGYIGYPMLSSPMGVYAARVGDRKLSLELFERGVADFIIDNFMQFDEFGKYFTQEKQKVGPYMAHAGGYLTACLYGLTGIKIDGGDPREWGKYSIVMPEGWDGIEAQVWIRGEKAKIKAMQGDERATITFL